MKKVLYPFQKQSWIGLSDLTVGKYVTLVAITAFDPTGFRVNRQPDAGVPKGPFTTITGNAFRRHRFGFGRRCHVGAVSRHLDILEKRVTEGRKALTPESYEFNIRPKGRPARM